ncbi:signal peptidase I [Lachnospiraceae bacterium MD1]|uniref:Signal peptidase I n=1 Tax=Variimorphobacter saccharofermentans TaxID=2755051 RepID=A0A839K049_9FIRM|nr:signal peptidase I [Variimorphobacter saccharofermentans]MBB2183006.1 signal peptidase I [Variimorphobacter saccharofermentans]
MDFDFDKESKRPFIKKIIIEIIIWIVQIAAVIFLAYFIIYYALEKTNMIGNSMETTLKDGDSVIINKFSYRFTDPKRFDVIVFKKSGKEHSYYDIKRIIGLPGERLQLKDGLLYINGEVVEDIIQAEPMTNYGLADEEIVLEENEYFVLGDNRNNSEDSRFASIGNIRRDEIVGEAFIRLKPFNFIQKLNLKSKENNEQE